MIRLYHDTMIEAHCSILKNGFCHRDVVWICSDSNMPYFYSDELVVKGSELDEQEAINKCYEMALQSAAFSVAVTNSIYRDFYAFEFLVDGEYWYIIKTDGSMRKSSAYSVCTEVNLPKKLTHSIYCTPEHYTSRLTISYLNMLERDYLAELGTHKRNHKIGSGAVGSRKRIGWAGRNT